jgi:hypothetical protein
MECEWRLDRAGDSASGAFGSTESGDWFEEHRELVSADSRDEVAVADSAGETATDLDKEGVSGGVADPVIGRLEVI